MEWPLTTRSTTSVVAVAATPEEVELVADELFALGATAVAELAGPDGVELVTELPPVAVAHLAAAGRSARILEHDPSWEDGWRAHARVWRCGEHLVVRPAWVHPEPLAPDDVEIVMEPGHAFGSGSHATTRLCLAALEAVVRPGHRVLDVGCGTGVLGVAAALLGASHVDAIDIDPEAVRVTRELAERNGVDDVVRASGTPLEQLAGTYDAVVANLLVPIIEREAGHLERLVAPGGALVVSGVLANQRDAVLGALTGLQVEGFSHADDWLALILVGRHRV